MNSVTIIDFDERKIFDQPHACATLVIRNKSPSDSMNIFDKLLISEIQNIQRVVLLESYFIAALDQDKLLTLLLSCNLKELKIRLCHFSHFNSFLSILLEKTNIEQLEFSCQYLCSHDVHTLNEVGSKKIKRLYFSYVPYGLELNNFNLTNFGFLDVSSSNTSRVNEKTKEISENYPNINVERNKVRINPFGLNFIRKCINQF